MSKSNFINAYVDFFDEKGNLVYENLGIILNKKTAEIEGIDKKILKGYYFIRKVNEFITEKYNISKVDYNDHPRNSFFRYIKMEIIKDGDEEDNKKNNFGNIINVAHNYGNVAYENNGNQNIQNINNEIDEIIKIINEKNIEQKEELKKLLEEYKETQDKNKLVEVFNIIGTMSSITGLNILAGLKVIL